MNKRVWIFGFIAVFLLLLSIASALPAQGHTEEELDQWVFDWTWRLWSSGGMTETLLEQHTDMSNRHPCYFNGCPPIVHTHFTGTRTYSAGVEQWRPLVAQYFRPGDVDTALRIMRCESGGDPNAVGKDQDIGLMQHLARYWVDRSAKAGWAGSSAFNPEANIAVAAWLRDSRGGWGHWTCY